MMGWAVNDIILQTEKLLHQYFPKELSPQESSRPSPAQDHAEIAMSVKEKKHTAALMRINHTGEVCAQALYYGQASVARSPELKQHLETAAQEEYDHLIWCYQRLVELDASPSQLNLLFHIMSYAMGVMTGKISDAVSLGFVSAV